MFDWLAGIAPRFGAGTRPAINASTWRLVARIEALEHGQDDPARKTAA